jgi:D-serine dehydratase
MLRGTAAGQAYLQRHGLQPYLPASTHIAWTTGGLFVPREEYARFLARGQGAAAAAAYQAIATAAARP